MYLGVLNKGRGIEIAIEALKELPEYNLILVGEGDNSQELRESAKGYKNIQFLGYRRPDELSAILNQASIGLNILQAESLNYKLSLANKFFDYMHAGLPSINMAYPEYKHIINQHQVGLMINNYHKNDLISAIRALDHKDCLLYTSPTPRDKRQSRMPSSA